SAGAALLPSAKETEARGLRVANREGAVMQHQDAGRVSAAPGEETPPHEIPPSYDSIRD
ncbi:hypothetical protein PHLGIDRAFT_123496, partial [Phlebiopsis gigantea 11061_1 CR5-6]